jgi:hypothetical protein
MRNQSEITLNLINLYKFVGTGWETWTELDFVPASVKKMINPTDGGELMQPKQLDLSEQDKSKKWRSLD